MKTIIKNGLVYINNKFEEVDVLFDNDRIIEIRKDIQKDADSTIDATNKHVFPGFIDLHSHLRDPGQTYKEDIISGTKAAAKGGFTTICCMPNTDPIIDNIATVEYINRKAKDFGFCKVKVIGAMTKKTEGKEIAEIGSMMEGGIVAVSDDGACIQNAKLLQNVMKYTSSFNIPVIIHAEDYNLSKGGQINAGKMSTKLGLGGIPGLAEEIIIARNIMIAEKAKCQVHIAHVSTKKAVDIIAEAKKNGLRITTEVTPHHLLLTEDACENFDTNTKVKPPLRTENDRQAMIKALNEGIIDFIATDHAPHSDFEKEREFNLAPFGINGFETAFATLYTNLVKKNEMSLEKLIEVMSEKPANFLKLNSGKIEVGKKADLVIADLNAKISFKSDNIISKANNTPFIGKTFFGKITNTFCDGMLKWSN